jgi:hypothetical protein
MSKTTTLILGVTAAILLAGVLQYALAYGISKVK